MVNLILVEFFYALFQSFATALFILMVLPVLIQVGLNAIIGMMNNMMRMDTRGFINLLLFPGAMLRITVMFFFLWLKGWKVKFVYSIAVGIQAPTSTGGRYGRGFSMSMYPPKHRPVSFWDALVFMAAGYTIWIVVLFVIAAKPFILIFLAYNFGAATAKTVTNYLILSMVFGGMPVPEETLLPLYWLAAYKPHMIISTIFALLSSAFATGAWGAPWGKIIFLGLMGYNLVIDQIHTRQYNEIISDNGLRILLDDIQEVFVI